MESCKKCGRFTTNNNEICDDCNSIMTCSYCSSTFYKHEYDEFNQCPKCSSIINEVGSVEAPEESD